MFPVARNTPSPIAQPVHTRNFKKPMVYILLPPHTRGWKRWPVSGERRR
jgi:hypothetical protein